jgi:hypothetical protein
MQLNGRDIKLRRRAVQGEGEEREALQIKLIGIDRSWEKSVMIKSKLDDIPDIINKLCLKNQNKRSSDNSAMGSITNEGAGEYLKIVEWC